MYSSTSANRKAKQLASCYQTSLDLALENSLRHIVSISLSLPFKSWHFSLGLSLHLHRALWLSHRGRRAHSVECCTKTLWLRRCIYIQGLFLRLSYSGYSTFPHIAWPCYLCRMEQQGQISLWVAYTRILPSIWIWTWCARSRSHSRRYAKFWRITRFTRRIAGDPTAADMAAVFRQICWT